MHTIIPIEEKKYHLFNIKTNKYDGYFYNYQHVLWWFKNYDLNNLAHNINDTVGHFVYPYAKAQYIREPKTYILYDSSLTVCSVDQLAKDIQSYQMVYPNPYRAIKRGTNKNRGYTGHRHNVHYYRNTVAYLIGESKEFPLNKREIDLKYRLYDWDNPERSNSSNSWKLQKKKRHQWEEKC